MIKLTEKQEIYKFDTLCKERKLHKIMQVETIALANVLGQYLVQANDFKLKRCYVLNRNSAMFHIVLV